MDSKTLALILAGGQGSRLGVLTKTVAKPAVLFGSKYRIIDFSLSNCANSGIYNVGIIEQYMPLKLNSHIGIGKPWDMDRMKGGATILTPYLAGEKGEWFSGTADAVYQNIHYIDKVNPEYVVILSGDHIYKMDYSYLVNYHKSKKSDCTISVIDVPIEEASRFGIMNADEKMKIFEFSEKPENPKSTLASMGVYIFNWSVLREALIKDHLNPDSSNDFGNDIIPYLLNSGKNLYAYRFNGYWKDVGTLTSYWETNMELTKLVPKLNLFDSNWRIYTPNPVKPAHYISKTGKATKSMVAEGCMIHGEVKNCILFPGVVVGENSYIENSIIMSNSIIGENCNVYKSIISEHCDISDDVEIGVFESAPNEHRPDLYRDDITVIGENSNIPKGIQIGKNVVIDADINSDYFTENIVKSGSAILKEAK